jgi:hypothetical protein
MKATPGGMSLTASFFSHPDLKKMSIIADINQVWFSLDYADQGKERRIHCGIE